MKTEINGGLFKHAAQVASAQLNQAEAKYAAMERQMQLLDAQMARISAEAVAAAKWQQKAKYSADLLAKLVAAKGSPVFEGDQFVVRFPAYLVLGFAAKLVQDDIVLSNSSGCVFNSICLANAEISACEPVTEREMAMA